MKISIENVSKFYKKNSPALRDISLEINQGMFGLLGPNGAGKTTLMRIIATIIQPTEGVVKIGNYRTDNLKEKWHILASLGYLPQELSLYGNLTPYEFLDFMGAIKGFRKRPNQIKELLEMVGLSNAAHQLIKTFSGGMKRRLGIAQALINNPSLLIVDEPTVGLDPEERTRFRNMLVDMASDRTVILSSHIVEDIAQTCYHVAILHQGKLLYKGTVSGLVQQANNKVWEYTSSNTHTPLHSSILVAKTRISDTNIKYRVLAEEQPMEGAYLVSPTIEDGYLWIIKKN
jgi:ABC-type multidrug transport system ATPase subunit